MPGLTRRMRGRVIAGLVALFALTGGVVAVVASQGKPLPRLTRAQTHYLTLAEQGVAQTSRWWDKKLDWYVAVLNDHSKRPLAKLWDTNGLFETLDEIAIAYPTSQNLAAVTAFANASERYWNGNLKPVGGYAPYIGDSSPKQQTWFDDNGWIGLAFLDAYRATGDTRYRSDAERAFTFIASGGWDNGPGGMWWSTSHPWRSGEALAADADLAARLYQATRKATYLKLADKYIGWADKHLLKPHGVYLPTADTPYPYLIEPKTRMVSTPTISGTTTIPKGALKGLPHGKATFTVKGTPGGSTLIACPKGVRQCKPNAVIERGAPAIHGPPRAANAKPTMVAMPHDGEGAMLSAITTLCEVTGTQSWCKAAEKLAPAEITWLAPFSDGPQYDSVLVRGLLTLYTHDHNPRWYRFAVAIAGLITKHAKTGPSLYLRGWDGRPVPSSTPGMLRTDAGSLAVFADLATVAPPS
jgi:Glycosyl hydrolase family 76